jgi:hypothetical protein
LCRKPNILCEDITKYSLCFQWLATLFITQAQKDSQNEGDTTLLCEEKAENELYFSLVSNTMTLQMK